MKLLLLLAIYCIAVQEAVPNRVRNDNCLNDLKKYKSPCLQPRSVFYAYHRVIMDCIRVTTKCPRKYTKNEYDSLGACRHACVYTMQLPPE